MAARGDLTVLHEPFGSLKDYGETDAGGRTFGSAARLLAWLRGEAHDRDVFLIRRPEEIAASYYALFPR